MLVVKCLKPPVKALDLLLGVVVGELLDKDGVVGEVPSVDDGDARTRIVKPHKHNLSQTHNWWSVLMNWALCFIWSWCQGKQIT